MSIVRPWALLAILTSLAATTTAHAGIRVLRDLPYGPAPEQRIDVYLPDAKPTNAPIIAMVHGGAWAFGDKSNAQVIENKSRRWVARGAVFVSINNRLLPKAHPIEQAEDVARALVFIQKEAKGWGADPAKLVLMGHSAGGHLVALLAADPARAKRFGAEPWLGTVVLDSGAFDVPQIMEGWHMSLYDRAFGRDAARWRQASPIHALTKDALPMLLVCSSLSVTSCGHARPFAMAAGKAGANVTILEQNLNHREINETLGLESDYTKRVEAFMSSVGLQLQ